MARTTVKFIFKALRTALMLTAAVIAAAGLQGCNKDNDIIKKEDPKLPVISLPQAQQGLTVAPGQPILLAPDFLHDDLGDFQVRWYKDGALVGREEEYIFRESAEGSYLMTIEAENRDGTSSLDFTIIVARGAGYSVTFVPLMFGAPTNDITVFSGQTVCLQPVVTGFVNPKYDWEVNGEDAGTAPCLNFTPQQAGNYAVTLQVEEWGLEVAAQTAVHVVAATEASRMRPATASSSLFCNKVYEYIPAPGQFINEPQELREVDHAAAISWAEGRLAGRQYVSLGSFGGSLVVGFDHSIPAGAGTYDFYIEGNCFIGDTGNSNEAGIVWVMQDANGNGLPDDQWYELAGSEYGKGSQLRNVAVTYYRPTSPEMPTPWTSSAGERGELPYLAQFHSQPYYYPSWVTADSYTLYGSMLPANYTTVAGNISLNPFDWGYADNWGSDTERRSIDKKRGPFTGFKISNARQADGTPVSLRYIDFVKIQSAMLGSRGDIGEASTEVVSVSDAAIFSN